LLQYFPAQKWTKFQNNQIFCCLSFGIPFDKVQRAEKRKWILELFYNNLFLGDQKKKGKENPKTFLARKPKWLYVCIYGHETQERQWMKCIWTWNSTKTMDEMQAKKTRCVQNWMKTYFYLTHTKLGRSLRLLIWRLQLCIVWMGGVRVYCSWYILGQGYIKTFFSHQVRFWV
jgi:hypothetical protein